MTVERADRVLDVAGAIGGALTAVYVVVHTPARSWLSDSLASGEGVT